MSLPGLSQIESDLRQVVRHGIGSLPDSALLPTLSSLLSVEQRQQGPNRLDTVMAIEGTLRQAIETLDGTPFYAVLELLFGLTPATTGTLAKQRRRAAAEAAGTDPGTFNRHDEQRLLRLLARRVYTLETEAHLSQERMGQPPTAEELRASWWERFTHYHRLQGVLRHLRLDLIAALLTYTEQPDEVGREDYLDSSIWRYARFLVAHDRFVDELGGLWVLPDPAADAEAKAAAELVLWHGPFNERGRSWLRTAIAQALNGELEPLARRVHDHPDGAELVGLWERWLESCRCDSDRPEESCRPHRMIDQCERYDLLIEEQWPRVRERYRELRQVDRP